MGLLLTHNVFVYVGAVSFNSNHRAKQTLFLLHLTVSFLTKQKALLENKVNLGMEKKVYLDLNV